MKTGSLFSLNKDRAKKHIFAINRRLTLHKEVEKYFDQYFLFIEEPQIYLQRNYDINIHGETVKHIIVLTCLSGEEKIAFSFQVHENIGETNAEIIKWFKEKCLQHINI